MSLVVEAGVVVCLLVRRWFLMVRWLSTVCFFLVLFSFARVGHIGPPLHLLSMMERRPLESWGVAGPPPCQVANAGLCDYKKKKKKKKTQIIVY